MHRRFALRALAATPLLAAGTGCALKQVHLEERNFLPNAPTALIDEGIRRVNVALKVEDDVLLHGWHLQHPQPRALLIDFLGNGDNVLAYAGQIHEIARPLAAQRGGLPLLAWGYSMGSMPAIHLAARRPLAGLAVLAGFSDFPDVRAGLEAGMPWFAKPFVKLSWDPVFEMRPQPVDEIAEVRAPIFLFHGEADAQLPVRCGDRLNEAAAQARWKRYVRAPGVGHGRLPLFKGETRASLEAWLAESLRT